tara:strand:+ start:473 stop:604 length:132 start_codon:yes stop_codon:yes gene_type:complete
VLDGLSGSKIGEKVRRLITEYFRMKHSGLDALLYIAADLVKDW